MSRKLKHHELWDWHPRLKKSKDRTLGERAADRMKAALATWAALIAMLVGMAIWISTSGFGADAFPFILLNLCLSTLAGLQCFVLLIANKRGEEIAAKTAQHTYDNTELLKELVQQNTQLTQEVKDLTLLLKINLIKELTDAPVP